MEQSYEILAVDDDAAIVNILETTLTQAGYRVRTARDGDEACRLAEMQKPHLIIMDVMMPRLDGYQVARQVRRQHCGVPILMLSARAELEDRVRGLNAGADYYLTKPFDLRELLACVNALLRRQGGQVETLTLGNTSLELASCLLVCGGKSVRLSAREFDVMRFLLQAGDTIVPKSVILTRVWGFDSDAVENHVEVYVGFLRKKLASIGSNIKICSLRRLGYHMEVDGSC